MKRKLLLIASIMVMHSSGLKAQTAMEIAADMYPGWNLGNTLEAGPCSWLQNELDCETEWQDTKTTQEIIDYVKSLGFRSVRIPQISRQVSRGSAGEYQADERAGVARLSWRVSGR